MKNWRDMLENVGGELEEKFDALKWQLQDRLNRIERVQIWAYRGHGTADLLHLRGRVLEDNGLTQMGEQARDSLWNNLLASYRRFETDEVPGVRVEARLGEVVKTAVTDVEGFYQITLPLDAALSPDQLWHEVSLTLLDPVGDVPAGSVQATARVMIPPTDAQFGLISDVDDTILQTHATNLLTVARLTFLHSAKSRSPFSGVAAFYAALQRGAAGNGNNPIFYVSSSPWNVYDLLTDFMRLQEIPDGVLFLRDYGIGKEALGASDHHGHKLTQIKHIFDSHPQLKFILLGDSGQKDPEIYSHVVETHPDRVLAVYIRDVTTDRRDAEVNRLIEKTAVFNIPMLLVPNTLAAAEHAARQGWISADDLPAIRADKARDEAQR